MVRALVVGLALLSLSLFGMYAGVGEHTHTTHCPYTPVANGACMAFLSHMSHWQAASIGPMVWLLFLLGVVLQVFVYGASIQNARVVRRVQCAKESDRPPLFASLFASGLLHPRVP